MLKYLTLLSLILVSSLYSQETHVFWYKALQNNYALSDSPGPNIPAGAIVHEGKIVTCSYSPGLGYNGSGFSCGSGPNDDVGWSSCLYSADFNNQLLSGTVDSVFIRGEYFDLVTSGGSTCTEGPIAIRCGVLDVSFGVGLWASEPGGVPDNTVFADLSPLNTLNYNLQLIEETVDTIDYQAILGRYPCWPLPCPTSLDSQFLRINVTKQLDWILQQSSGQYAVALLSALGQGSTGKFLAWADETCSYDSTMYIRPGFDAPHPWTKDGNTVHLLVYGDLTDSVHTERPSTTTEQASAVSICPNPFNPSTTISYDIPGNGQAKLAIFSAAGKLIYQKQVSGKGSYTWDASAQPSGVYVCRVNSGRKTFAKKMILIR